MSKSKIIISFALFVCLLGGYSQELRGHGAEEGAIAPEQLNASLGEVKILDVRSEQDYEKAHIETALVLPLKEISEARLTQLGFQQDEPLIVYAASDNLAKKAKVLLEAIGFSSVKYLSGGFTHWKEDRFPTVSGKMKIVVKGEETPNVSSLSLQPAKHDFGIIRQEDGVVTTTFSLRNTGDKPVTIEEISTSCGCTSAKVSEKVVLPGKTVSLKVFFDSNFHKEPQGKFSRTVFLQTSEGIELEAEISVQIQE